MSDIFLALPGATVDGSVLFGKNSDRPQSEVQEVIYVPPSDHDAGGKLHCTFIEVDQVSHTYGAVLSKPAWAWGAEMGANENGVCIGNTAVWTKLCHPGDHAEKLIGVDFVRLGLERSKSAKDALDVISGLLERYGQGGPCAEDHSFSQWTYHSSFLIADRSEAWVLDTAGQFWAAHKLTRGTYNISSTLTIGSAFDVSSSGLREKAKAEGYWKPEDGDFNFTKVFGASFTGMSLSEAQVASNRLQKGKELLEAASNEGKLNQTNIFNILRDEKSSINFSGELQTVSSQVSLLRPEGSKSMDIHWFTATPNPSLSVFKPFMFSPEPSIGYFTVSPNFGDKARSSFQTAVDRRHPLFKAHEKGRALMEGDTPAGKKLLHTMQRLETDCLQDTREFVQDIDDNKLQELNDLFNDFCETEVKFYK
ncbi:secernin-2-like [Haliotis rubra]|uniref:secernin-2-like n=1 Tax=Haliotis rubra TaxID=36100 RepID=UPI001EE5270E|nr:secernin-2-like [Haliotis rubra]